MPELAPIEIDPKTFLYGHCELPVLPEVLAKVQQLISSDDFTPTKVAEIISTDPSMVAEVLKVANSAYYSFPNEIKDVKFAVAYMGIIEVQRIVLSMSVINTLSSEDLKSFNKIWFHSAYTALITQYLVKKYEPLIVPGEIWAAAILHDVGKLIYLKFFPDHFRAMIEFSENKGCLFSEAEQYYKLPKSSYFGELLCDRWRLPVRIKDACTNHSVKDMIESKDSSLESTFRRMISAGNLMALMLNNELDSVRVEKITNHLKKIFNLSDSDFMLLAADLSDLKVEAENFVEQ